MSWSKDNKQRKYLLNAIFIVSHKISSAVEQNLKILSAKKSNQIPRAKQRKKEWKLPNFTNMWMSRKLQLSSEWIKLVVTSLPECYFFSTNSNPTVKTTLQKDKEKKSYFLMSVFAFHFFYFELHFCNRNSAQTKNSLKKLLLVLEQKTSQKKKKPTVLPLLVPPPPPPPPKKKKKITHKLLFVSVRKEEKLCSKEKLKTLTFFSKHFLHPSFFCFRKQKMIYNICNNLIWLEIVSFGLL